jgi:hypothetical protein
MFKENVWAKIKLRGKDTLLIGCIYKSPTSDSENIVTKKIIFSPFDNGRLQFPKIDWKNWSNGGDKEGGKFMEAIRDSYLIQHA